MPSTTTRTTAPPLHVQHALEHREHFERSLRRSMKGNLWCKVDGDTVTIFRRWDKWAWCIVREGSEAEPVFSPRKYGTEEETVAAAWEHLYGV